MADDADVYPFRELLEQRVNELLLKKELNTLKEVFDASLLRDSLQYIQRLEKERDDALSIIDAFEDVIHAAQSTTKINKP
jgi:hypothetical protein